MSEQGPGTSYRAVGKRVHTSAFKQTIIADLKAGATAAEFARKHQTPMQNIIKWPSQVKKLKEPEIGKSISASLHAQALEKIKRLQAENKKLIKSLSTMTVDRDILKDAVDYASKKSGSDSALNL